MMKARTLVLLFPILFTGLYVHAQFSNLVIFTQEKEPFTVIINGVQQNPEVETNVKITGLKAPSYKVKIHFQNAALPEINKTVYLQAESESTCEVLKNSKGLFVLRLLTRIPMDEVTGPVEGQDIFVYTMTPRISSTSVSQTTTVHSGALAGGISVSTTTTHTTTTTGPAETVENGHLEDADRQEYSGPTGCQRPMSPRAFDDALESISSKTFASSKLTIAKQVAASNCLRCKQVKEIMKLFTFESDKLEFAKFAYKYTWDIRNYFLLNDAFEFESSIDELNRFINRR